MKPVLITSIFFCRLIDEALQSNPTLAESKVRLRQADELYATDTAAQASLASIQRQYALGAVNYINVLTAQQQAQLVRLTLIEAQAQRLVNSAAFYQAMEAEGQGCKTLIALLGVKQTISRQSRNIFNQWM